MLHGMDPRVKILLGTGYFVVAALLTSLPAQILSLAGGAALMGLARLPAREVARRLLVVNVFWLMLWALLPWTTPSTGRPSTIRAIFTVNSSLRLTNSRVPSSGSINH